MDIHIYNVDEYCGRACVWLGVFGRVLISLCTYTKCIQERVHLIKYENTKQISQSCSHFQYI